MDKKRAKSDFSMRKVDSRLAAMYTSDEDKLGKYDRWAGSYESDLLHDLDYVAHIEATKIFSKVVADRRYRILDVACGTGLVGVELAKLGYTNVDGTDFSIEMLRISEKRNVYRELKQHDFTVPLSVSGQYEALICVGLFSFGIPGIQHMINVIRAVKPGGHCVITVNGAAWIELNLGNMVQKESAKHGFTIEQTIEADYIQREGIDSKVLVIRSPGEI